MTVPRYQNREATNKQQTTKQTGKEGSASDSRQRVGDRSRKYRVTRHVTYCNSIRHNDDVTTKQTKSTHTHTRQTNRQMAVSHMKDVDTDAIRQPFYDVVVIRQLVVLLHLITIDRDSINYHNPTWRIKSRLQNRNEQSDGEKR